MSSPQPPVPPVLVLAFGILAVSAASIFIRFAQGYSPSLVIAAYRLSLAALVLTPLAFTQRRRELTALDRRKLGLALLSGFFLAVHFATWISSLEFTTVASSVVLVSTVPLWVGLLAPITIKEPLTRPLFAGMVLALLGGIIVAMSDSCVWGSTGILCPSWGEFVKGRAFLGNVLAFIGAISAAGYFLIGRNLRPHVSALSYIYLVYGMSAVILILFVFVSGYSLVGYPSIAYFWFILLALVPQLVGHTTYNWALGYLSAAYVSIALLGEPIGSAILAYLILDETPTLEKIIGAILILIGIFIASMSETKGVKR